MPDFATHIMETESSQRLKRNAAKEKKWRGKKKGRQFPTGLLTDEPWVVFTSCVSFCEKNEGYLTHKRQPLRLATIKMSRCMFVYFELWHSVCVCVCGPGGLTCCWGAKPNTPSPPCCSACVVSIVPRRMQYLNEVPSCVSSLLLPWKQLFDPAVIGEIQPTTALVSRRVLPFIFRGRRKEKRPGRPEAGRWIPGTSPACTFSWSAG